MYWYIMIKIVAHIRRFDALQTFDQFFISFVKKIIPYHLYNDNVRKSTIDPLNSPEDIVFRDQPLTIFFYSEQQEFPQMISEMAKASYL